ncbi:MAG: hypothetical protein QXM16_06125 [Nitrososphaerota archaeon]
MSKFTLLSIMAAVIGAVTVAAFLPLNPLGGRGAVVVFTAPTLVGVAKGGADLYGSDLVDVRSIGSVMGIRLIQSGNVPDVFLSVDWELLKFIQPRRVLDLGHFRLLLVCRGNYSLNDLGYVKIGLANPNFAPIGYRSLAAIYWLGTKYELVKLDELSRSLNIRYIHNPSDNSVMIDVRNFEASGRFRARDDLAGVATLLEGGVVDCIFGHSPFIVARGYAGRFKIIEMPDEITFLQDPPTRFVAVTVTGLIEVKAFRAFAASFTPTGDNFLDKIEQIDLEKYGLWRSHG